MNRLKSIVANMEKNRKEETINVRTEISKLKTRINHLFEYGEPHELAELVSIFKKKEKEEWSRLKEGKIELLEQEIKSLARKIKESQDYKKKLSARLYNLKREKKPKEPCDEFFTSDEAELTEQSGELVETTTGTSSVKRTTKRPF